MKPEPDSETRNPKDGLATTLTHGSGVRKPSFRDDHVFTATIREAAEAIEELQSSACGKRASGDLAARAGRARVRSAGSGYLRSHNLFGQRAAAAQQHSTRHGLQLRASVWREQIAAQQEYFAAHAARNREKAAAGSRVPALPASLAAPARRMRLFR